MAKIDKNLFWLIGFGLIFFLIYSYLALSFNNQNQRLIFNSPDETANYFFSDLFASQSTIKFGDPANLVAEELVTPRSMRVIKGQTVPAGFMGLSLIFGTLAKITGSGLIPFFTPIIAILGIIFFYFLLKKLFDQKVAFISALFLFIFPGYWYYATKGLMPNVAFVSFFIMTFYFFISAIRKSNIWPYVFFGFFLSLSLIIRTSEIFWIAILFFVLIVYNFKKINFKLLILSFLVFLLVFSPIFFFNQQIYGSPLSYGYSLDIKLQDKTVIAQGLTLMEKLFLPFGFHPRLALKNLFNYTFGIFPIWSFLFLVGLLTFSFLTFKNNNQRNLLYLLTYFGLGCYLVIYYGSWLFYDNPDPLAVTIGTSYIRYWLPLYLFGLPFISITLLYFLRNFKLAKILFIIYLFCVLVLASYQTVFLSKDEGLLKVKSNLIGYQNLAQVVVKQTEDNAVIIADKMDKVFFPARSVIYKLNNPQDYDRIKQLIVNGYQVYYFYFTRDSIELEKFNQKYFYDFGLKVGESLIDFDEQSLYPVLIN